MRDITPEGKATKTRGEGTAWAKLYKGQLGFILFGHDAARELQMEEFAIGLDTGCLYGKKLTGVIFPGNKLVQVPAKKMYKDPNVSEK
jgi:hypothetical protein